MDEIVCKELVEIVTEYLEDTLAAERRAQFEAHLSTCEGCTNYLAQMQQTINLAGKIPYETLTPSDKQQLLKLFSDWNQSR